MSTSRLPPGPQGKFLTGNLPAFNSNPLGFLTGAAREFGPVVRLRFARLSAYLLSDPRDIEEVLITRRLDFIKGRPLRAHRELFGDGLLTSEGDFWSRQRRLAQPAFHQSRLAAYGELMAECVRRMLATWGDGETRDVHEEMKRLTLAIVSKTLFNVDVTAEAGALSVALEKVMEHHAARRGLSRLIPAPIPVLANLRFKRAVRQIDRVIYEIIERRRAGDEDDGGGDLLAMLTRARDEDGTRMSARQLRDEALTLFLAGYDTPALALSWMWFLLSQDEGVDERLAAELRSVLGGRVPGVADLKKLPYAEMVVKETLRLYPPAWIISREALRECELGGYHVPAGTQLLISQWVMHRDPRFFDEPEEFRPERWAGALTAALPRFVYFPFGGGARACIGGSFAMTQTILALAAVAQQFKMKLAPGGRPAPNPALTLRPEGGVRVVLSRR